MEKVLVADVMTRDPVTISPETSLLECTKTMVRKRVGSLLLTRKKRLLGIISEKDILWVLIKKTEHDLSKIKAFDISPKKIATIKPTATIKEALQKMKKLKFRKLPVIQNGDLVGVVTIRDILNFNPEFYPELEEFAEIRERTEKLKRVKKAKERKRVREGICEECGREDMLLNVDGRLICNSCRELM